MEMKLGSQPVCGQLISLSVHQLSVANQILSNLCFPYKDYLGEVSPTRRS